MSTQNYNASAGAPLTRGKVQPDGTAIGAGGILDTDILCVGDNTLVVEIDMTGGAAGDLAVEVRPFAADNTNVNVLQLPPVQSDGPDLSGGHVYFMGRYDIDGIDKVRIRITNNNAGAQTLTRTSWRLT